MKIYILQNIIIASARNGAVHIQQDHKAYGSLELLIEETGIVPVKEQDLPCSTSTGHYLFSTRLIRPGRRLAAQSKNG